MNATQQHLAHADNCIRGRQTEQRMFRQRREKANSTNAQILSLDEARLQREIDRLQGIREDLASKLTADELVAYDATRVVVKSEAQLKLERAAQVKAMNENKDRPGI